MKKRLSKNPQQKAQAGNRRMPENKKAASRAGLTFSEKKRLMELRRILAGNGKEQAKPDTAQKTITFKKMFRDGICQVTHNFYTKMVEFYDINYDLLEVEDQGDILEEYSKIINYFDPSIKFELFLFNRQVNEQALAEQFDISCLLYTSLPCNQIKFKLPLPRLKLHTEKNLIRLSCLTANGM